MKRNKKTRVDVYFPNGLYRLLKQTAGALNITTSKYVTQVVVQALIKNHTQQ